MAINKGLAVIVRTEQEYMRLREFLGFEIAYLDWVPQMAKKETSIVIWYIDDNLYSIGSLGSSEYQRMDGIRTVEFSEFFKL